MNKPGKFVALMLTLALCLSLLAGCKSDTSASSSGGAAEAEATYTYSYAYLDTTTTWNPHEVMVTENITSYTEIDMWECVLNDTADGYIWVCEMAAEEPEDVTAEYAGDMKWGIPADATEGYAWRVALNPDAKWEDGTPINADSYVYSMSQLLNPEMNNYTAADFYTTMPLKNAENYAKSGQGSAMYPVVDLDTWEYADYGDGPLYISFTQPTSAFYGYTAEQYYPGYESYYVNEAGEDLLKKYGGEDYVAVTDEVIADINYMLMNWYGTGAVDESSYLDMAFYAQELEDATFEDVGFFKTGEYELTVILYRPMTVLDFKTYAGSFALVNEEKYEAGKMQTGDMIKTNYGTSADTYMSFGPYKLITFQPDKEWRVTRNENWYGWTDGKHEGLYQATDVVCNIIEDAATQEQLFLQGKTDVFSLSADNLSKYQSSDYIFYSPGSAIWLLNINNDYELLAERETPGVNKTILTYTDFRKGISLAIDRQEFLAQQGYGKACYGLISDYYVYDAENGYSYRDSEAAQETLKTFYGVDDVDEITGYDLEAARACLVSGYEQALADGVVQASDRFVFDYPTFSTGTREIIFLQNALDAATKGTVLEGRVTVNQVVSENYYNVLDAGEYDICMSGWNGEATNPYDLMRCYVTDIESPQAYFGFDPQTETLEIQVNGKAEVRTYYDWYNILCNGEYALLDADSRNEILAAMELGLLQKYRDCPFWSSSTAQLMGQKINFPTYEYIVNVGFGGIRSMTFNYTDAEWDAYCRQNNYQLDYQ